MGLRERVQEEVRLWLRRHDPYRYWRQARKLFKAPRPCVVYAKDAWFYGLPIADRWYKKYLTVQFSPLGWKMKYDTVRHEWDPMLWFCWKRRWFLIISFSYGRINSIADSSVWECILETVVNKRPFKEALRLTEFPDEPIERYLTKRGKKEYEEYKDNPGTDGEE